MEINGNIIPNSFIKKLKNNIFFRETGSFHLKKENDSFGYHLETELGQIFSSNEKIIEETNNLNKYFKPDGIYGTESEWKSEPGFIEDITDFSQIVAFGISGDGSPFCFDYREYKNQPEIIWWDDVYWRKISPNFTEFLELFELNS